MFLCATARRWSGRSTSRGGDVRAHEFAYLSLRARAPTAGSACSRRSSSRTRWRRGSSGRLRSATRCGPPSARRGVGDRQPDAAAGRLHRSPGDARGRVTATMQSGICGTKACWPGRRRSGRASRRPSASVSSAAGRPRSRFASSWSVSRPSPQSEVSSAPAASRAARARSRRTRRPGPPCSRPATSRPPSGRSARRRRGP